MREEGHTDQSCVKPCKCANCSGDHPAYSKQCPHWRKQAEITKVKTERGISFRDAQDIVEKRMDSGPQAGSYASKVGNKPIFKNLGNVTVSCQTDLTWPFTSEAPLPLISVFSPTLSLVAEAASQTAQSKKIIESTIPVSHITIQIPSTSVTPSSSTNASPSTSTFVAPKQIHLNTGKKLLLISARTPGKNPG